MLCINSDFQPSATSVHKVNILFFNFLLALTGSESDGSLLVEQYAPCSLCASLGQKNQVEFPANEHSKDGDGVKCEDDKGREAGVYYFNMEDCVLAAVEKEHIVCPLHPDQPVPLQELVPELFMTDFPAR